MNKKTIIPAAIIAAGLGVSSCGYFGDNGNQGSQPQPTTQQTQTVTQQPAPAPSVDFGSIDLKDGKSGSVDVKLNFGKDFNYGGWKLQRDGTTMAQNDTTVKTFTDSNVTDGTEYGYELVGINDTDGTLANHGLEGKITPFDDAFDYGFEVDAKDVVFDDDGNVTVGGDFEGGAAGNRINGVKYTLVDKDGKVLDSETFNQLDKGEEPFTLTSQTYRGDAKVLGELLLEQGANVTASDTVVVKDDMPQMILKPNNMGRTFAGYDVQLSDFDTQAEADSLIADKNFDGSGVKNRTVVSSVLNANELVGKWVTVDGKIVNSYEEAFKTPVVVAKTAKVSDWRYNPNYDLKEWADGKSDGRIDLAVIQKGNTVSGALEAVAKEARSDFDIENYDSGKRSFKIKNYEAPVSIDSLVRLVGNKLVNDSTVINNFDPLKIQEGYHLEFTEKFQNMIYGEAEEKVVENHLDSRTSADLKNGNNTNDSNFDSDENVQPTSAQTRYGIYDLNEDGKISYDDQGLFLDAYGGDENYDFVDYSPGVNAFDFYEGIINEKYESAINRESRETRDVKFVEGFDDYKENVGPNLRRIK
jgi:hypothetical protein